MFSNLPQNELTLRWNKVQQALQAQQVDACLIANNVNLLYLSGRVFNGFCYIPSEGEPLFFVRRPIGLEGKNVFAIKKPDSIPDTLRQQGINLPKNLLLEGDQLSYNEQSRLMSLFEPTTVGNASLLMRQVRSVKTPFEVDLMREVGQQHVRCQEGVAALFRPGMTDLEFAHAIHDHFLRNGSIGVFRMFGSNMEISLGGSILAGDNALNPSPYDFALGGGGVSPAMPIGCDGRKIEPGMAVMVDVGGSFSAYMTDMTRVYAYGPLHELAYRAHQFSIELHRYVQQIALPGKACSDIYLECVERVEQAGLKEYFMGFGQQSAFVGHGVGMEVNELPVLFQYSKAKLEEGVIFALEPKFVIPGVGAVGVENTYAVHANQCELLTPMAEEIIQL